MFAQGCSLEKNTDGYLQGIKKMFTLCWPSTSIASLALAILGMTGCEDGPLIIPLKQPVGTSSLKSPPFLVSGSTEQRFLAAFDNNLYVWNFDGHQIVDPQPLPFGVKKIVYTDAGALAVGREGFIPIDKKGAVQTPLMFEKNLGGMYWTMALGEKDIFVASAGLEHDLTVQVYQFDGQSLGLPYHFVRPKFGTILTSSRLGVESYVLVWEEDGSLYAMIFSNEGHLLRESFPLYSVGKGGALQRGFAQRRADSSVLVAWQDSSPGPWSVMALIINPDRAVRTIGRVNLKESTDATRVSIPNGGNGQLVAWISGTHWGKFAVSGRGRVLVHAVDKPTPAFLCEASGSIQSFSVAMQGSRALVLGTVRQATAEDQTLGYEILAGFAGIPN
jgi:hypothetical protein